MENLKTRGIDIQVHKKSLIICLPSNGQLTVFDISGRPVICKFIYNGSYNMPLPANGMYIVKLAGKWGVITRRLFAE